MKASIPDCHISGGTLNTQVQLIAVVQGLILQSDTQFECFVILLMVTTLFYLVNKHRLWRELQDNHPFRPQLKRPPTAHVMALFPLSSASPNLDSTASRDADGVLQAYPSIQGPSPVHPLPNPFLVSDRPAPSFRKEGEKRLTAAVGRQIRSSVTALHLTLVSWASPGSEAKTV